MPELTADDLTRAFRDGTKPICDVLERLVGVVETLERRIEILELQAACHRHEVADAADDEG